MTKRLVILVSLCLVFLLTFSAITGAKTEIVFRQFDPPAVIEGLKEALNEFNRRNPEIEVRLETVPEADFWAQIIREGAVGTGPDLIHLGFVRTMELAEAGMLMNLDELVLNYPLNNSIDDFLGLELGIFDENLYGVPWTVDTFTMVYRDDILGNYGLKGIPDTWEDFQSEIVKIARERSAPMFVWAASGAAGSGTWFLANYYIWSEGFNFVEQDLETGKWSVGIEKDELAEAISYFKRFFDEGATPTSALGINYWSDPTILQGFASGAFPITFCPPDTFKAILSANPNLPAKSGLVPRGEVKRISHLGGRALGISKFTEHPEETWKLLSFLTSREFFETYYTGQLPAQRKLLQEIEFPEPMKGYAEQLQYAQTFYQYVVSPAPVSGMWNATNTEFSAAFSGLKSPEQAAEDLLREIAEFLP